MATATPIPSPVSSAKTWAKRIAIAMVLVIIAAIIAGQIKTHTNVGSSGYRWEPVETIDCHMGNLRGNLGWCQGKKTYQPTETYRIKMIQTYWRLNSGDKYDQVSHLGINLNRWDNDRNFQDEFLETVPVKKSSSGLLVGMLIAKFGKGGKAFEVRDLAEIKPKTEAHLSIGPNFPQKEEWYDGHFGTITVKVERRVKEEE